MEVKCAHTEIVGIETLVPNPKNPNKHPDKQIKLLAKIMKHQGWRNPIVVSKRSGFMVKGHGRLDAAKLNGWQTAPIDRQDYASEADEWADMIADNKIAELAESDELMIQDIAIDLGPDFDFDLFGIPNFEIQEPEKIGLVEDDALPEKVEPKTKVGDIYELGEHRLMCGDSTSIDAVEKLMNGEKADMVFTDPPYGISIVNSGTVGATSQPGFVGAKKAPSPLARAREYRPIIGDDEPFDPNLILGLGFKTIILWGANHYASKLPDKPQWLIWDKKLESGSLDHNNFSDCELAWTNSDSLSAKIYRHTWAGMLRKGERKEELKDRVHPTQKPVGLCADIINDFSKIGEAILDLFGGSGSTLIACEKTNRKCFMMELDPHYCDVIVTRWENFTGKKAKLIDSEQLQNSGEYAS